MDDRLQQIGVGAGGRLLEEAAADEASPVGHALALKVGGRRRLQRGQIEHRAGRLRMRLQHCGQQGAVAAADVDQAGEAAEVVGLQHRAGHRNRLVGHGLVEHRHLPGIGGHVLEP